MSHSDSGKKRPVSIEEQVVLVDGNDRERGAGAKLETHRRGLLHRAFSIFVFDKEGRLLIQQRALTKYHSGGLWANTCCGHPRPGEAIESAAHRRLREEFGFDCPLEEIFSFTYKAELDHGLTENEYDHVFRGEYAGPVNPDPSEIAAYEWIRPTELRQRMKANPGSFAAWFRLAIERVLADRGH